MTTINRICFELSDIVAIELECKKCKTITCYPKGDWTPAWLKCPNSGCGQPLIRGSANDPSEELRALDEFVTGLKRVLNHSKEFAFSLRLEFNQP
jgi:hypothetical protein